MPRGLAPDYCRNLHNLTLTARTEREKRRFGEEREKMSLEEERENWRLEHEMKLKQMEIEEVGEETIKPVDSKSIN